MIPATFVRKSRSVLIPVLAAAAGGVIVVEWPPLARIAGAIARVCWLYIVTGARG